MSRVIALAGLALLAFAAPSAAAPPSAVNAEIGRISQGIDGVVGVAAWRLDGRGPRVLVNADQQFPMASTFKVAVAGKILTDVDRGRLTLDQQVPVPHAMMVESEGLASAFHYGSVSVSVRDLLELMLTVSDNTAADVLTKLAGGPAPVTAWVRRQGVEGLRVDRDTSGLIRDFFHIPPGSFPEALAAAIKADPELENKASLINPQFDADPRDTSTPRAMASLLER